MLRMTSSNNSHNEPTLILDWVRSYSLAQNSCLNFKKNKVFFIKPQ